MKNKHTKGPWKIIDEGDKWELIGENDWIANIISGYDRDIENAQLIASTPDLIECVQEVYRRLKPENNEQTVLYGDSLHPFSDDDCKTFVDYLEEVLNKTRGGK